MSVSEVSVINSALVLLGADRISSRTQDTRAAVLANAIFDQTRDDVFRAGNWHCATKRAIISPTATTPDYEYTYEYDLPNDCIKIIDTREDSANQDPDYILEGRKILSDYKEMGIRYVYRNEDPSSWDSCFAEAFSWRLAQKLAYALTQSTEREKSCEDGYKKSLAQARSMNAMEGTLKGIVADRWTNARR